MYILVILIHVVICLVLIATILLQAGRGAGLTEAFGGEAAQSLLGTNASGVLKRATEVCAIAFLVTSLLLGIMTARKGRSIFETMPMPSASQNAATANVTPVSVPADKTEMPVPTEEEGK